MLLPSELQTRNAMNRTPRMRSDFPDTPGPATRRRQNVLSTPTPAGAVSPNDPFTRSPALPLAPQEPIARRANNQPRIPLTFVDAPSQRLYAFAVYIILWAWKIYDWLQVIEEGDASFLLFFKWIIIDFAFLFGLPELKIPWLELSQFTSVILFVGHLVLNYMLMFNIPVSHSVIRILRSPLRAGAEWIQPEKRD
ncbi:hypothetical protein E4U15_003351 [Claviceps sp. LM218 group G6]|nr:hypothetical protein E4U15_003351 [Claviceps sp. LM218 group G6]